MRRLLEAPPAAPRAWALLALALAACHAAAPAKEAGAVKRYTVRAQVAALPARPGGELMLRHEAIPDFTDRTGKVVGMAAMVMPFPPAPDLSLEGLAVGDEVEAVFSVDWSQGRYTLERLQRLPPREAGR